MQSRSQRRRHRRLTWAVLGVAALGLLAGGIAYATIPGGLYGDINGCFNDSSGRLRVIDPSAGGTCDRRESPISGSRGYAQEIERPTIPDEAPGAAHTPIVGSSLLGGRNSPFGYVVTAKTIIHTKDPGTSECVLVAWRNDIPEFVLDTSRNGLASDATHNLQGLVTGPINVQLRCRADAYWTAEQSSIIGTQTGQWTHGVAADAEPVSP